MIVTLGDKKLWVEGDKAYSVEDIQYKHELLNKSKSELESEIDKETNIINDHTNLKNIATDKLANINAELEGVEFIYNKIMNAETPVQEVVLDSPTIKVDQEVMDEEVKCDEDEIKCDEEVAVVSDQLNEELKTEDAPKSIIFNESEATSQPITLNSHRRFRI